MATATPITAPPRAHSAHVAYRALAAADQADSPRSLYRLLRALRFAEAATSMPGISDEKVDALSDQAALLFGMVARAPIAGRWDAIAKLELVADSFEQGARYDEIDAAMLRQVIEYLRGGAH